MKKNRKRKNVERKKKIISLCILIFMSIIFYFHSKSSNIKVCVCTCGRQENKYALEFVLHYKKYKVDKIFIYDNNKKNGENFTEVLLDYIRSGFVEIINFREKEKVQMEAFNHCYKKNLANYDWFIFYDMDEFINLKNFNNIKDYLNRATFKKCNIIYLNHIIHLDNNQIHYLNQSLFLRFPEIENFKNANYSYRPRDVLRDVTKIIIRGNISKIQFTNPHLVRNTIGNTCNGFGKIIFQIDHRLKIPDHKKFFFDHFYFKSSEEYLNKLDVGDVFYGNKRGFNIYWFQIYFAFNEIKKEKLDFFENKTGINLSIFRNNIS